MSFCSGTDCHLCWNLKSFQGRVHYRLFCQMHYSILVAMSDGNVSQWRVTGCHGWSGWINLSFCASSGIWSLLWQDMFLRSQGLVVPGAEKEGSKDGLCLEVFLRFPLDLNMFCHVASVCVWDASGLLGVKTVKTKFTTVPVWLLL